MPPLPTPSDDTVPARYARGLIDAAARFGADPAVLFAASGLDEAAVSDPDGWVCGRAMVALWAAAVEETGEPDLGLRVGSRFRMTSLSIVGYVMLSAATLGEAFECLARCYPLLATGQSARLDVKVAPGVAALEFEVPTSGYPLPSPRQAFEVVVAAVPTVAETLTGRALPVLAVEMAHARPMTGVQTHVAVLGVEPTFGAPRYRVAFQAEALRWTVRSRSPTLHAAFMREAKRALARISDSVRTRAARAVEARLHGAVPALKDVAADLAMSDRTLQRHLEAEGTTFQGVCDHVRREAALRLLADPSTTIHEVAYELGYSAPSAFHRAFKRWTGETPAAYRAGATAPRTHPTAR